MSPRVSVRAAPGDRRRATPRCPRRRRRRLAPGRRGRVKKVLKSGYCAGWGSNASDMSTPYRRTNQRICQFFQGRNRTRVLRGTSTRTATVAGRDAEASRGKGLRRRAFVLTAVLACQRPRHGREKALPSGVRVRASVRAAAATDCRCRGESVRSKPLPPPAGASE